MFRVEDYYEKRHIQGSMRKYLCTSNDDIDKLPKFGIPGTQETDNPKQDKFENTPCAYGSTAIISDGGATNAYKLFPDNEWKKL